MTIEQAIFIVVSVITLGSGLVVVTNHNLFHAALAMMLSFLGVAGMYVLLDAGFLAAAQLLVYIGAISILVIFAIMMTRRLMQTTESPYNTQWVLGGGTAVFAFFLMVLTIIRWWPTTPANETLATRPQVAPGVLEKSVTELGKAFVSPDAFVIPFEVASVLLLAALIGAILIAWPKAEEEA